MAAAKPTRKQKPKSAEVAVVVERDPWEKQPGETGPAWHAFVMYRDLGYNRTIRRVAEIHAETAPDRNLETIYGQLKRWSTSNGWHARCEAYDLIVDRRMREARESEIERTNRQHAQSARALQVRAMARVVGGKVGDEKIAAAPLDEVSFESAARVFELAVKIERVASGRPSDMLRGALVATQAEVEGLVRKIIDGWLPLIPEDAHPQALGILEAIIQGRA